MPQDRRLAAIMFTDIVGYTALMGSDEERAFEVLLKNLGIHSKLIEKFNSKLIKEIGDGMLVSFTLAPGGFYKPGRYEDALKVLKQAWDLRPYYDHEMFMHIKEVKKALAGQAKREEEKV
jgi:class 3 adenylate cyclase